MSGLDLTYFVVLFSMYTQTKYFRVIKVHSTVGIHRDRIHLLFNYFFSVLTAAYTNELVAYTQFCEATRTARKHIH